MEYALDRFTAEIRHALLEQGQIPVDLVELVTPKAGIAADLAFPTFRAARERGEPAPELARALAGALRFGPGSLVGGVAAAGPFLNFSFAPDRLAAAVLTEVAAGGARYGHDDRGAGRTVVVEYSSPNMARRMHVGHIRTTIIGQALANIIAALGYRVIRDNHIGDWGKNFGVLIAALQREGRPAGAALRRVQSPDRRGPDDRSGGARPIAAAGTGRAVARDLWRWIVELTLRINAPDDGYLARCLHLPTSQKVPSSNTQ